MISKDSRIVAQFSCGAASAVATKLALADYGGTHDVQILNAYPANEHEDNRRFIADCEAWFGRPVTVLRDEKYGADITASAYPTLSYCTLNASAGGRAAVWTIHGRRTDGAHPDVSDRAHSHGGLDAMRRLGKA